MVPNETSHDQYRSSHKLLTAFVCYFRFNVTTTDRCNLHFYIYTGVSQWNKHLVLDHDNWLVWCRPVGLPFLANTASTDLRNDRHKYSGQDGMWCWRSKMFPELLICFSITTLFADYNSETVFCQFTTTYYLSSNCLSLRSWRLL